MYEVTLTRAATKGLDKLEGTTFEKVWSAVTALGSDPRLHGYIKLTGVNAYRIRVGNYRIVYDIDDKARVVDVLDIGNRKDIYRRWGR